MAETKTVQDQAEGLLQRGLDHYALGQADEAVRCWRAARALAPDDRRAAEYLEAAGGASPATAPATAEAPRRRAADQLSGLDEAALSGPAAAGVDRSLLRRQLAERRYEDALALLYRWREAKPEDDEIARGIRLLEERLILDYSRTLGGDGGVPRPAVPPGDPSLAALDAQARELLGLVDGSAPLSQIVGRSHLGRFEAYRRLAELQQSGLLAAPPPATAGHPAGPAPSGPEEYDALFHRGTVAYLRCDYDGARRDFEACQRLRPDDRRAQQNLRKLEDRRRGP